jgi:integrase
MQVELNDIRKPSVHLFAVKKAPGVWVSLTSSEFDRRLERALARANLQHLGFTGHSLRKGGATTAFRSGISQVGIMRLGDWKSAAVTRYIQADYSDNLATARRLADGIHRLAL